SGPIGGSGSTHVAANGVRLTLPPGWSRIPAANDAPITDPRTRIVAGTRGVYAIHSRCSEIASYHLPATGAVVVVVGWGRGGPGGGPRPGHVRAARADLRPPAVVRLLERPRRRSGAARRRARLPGERARRRP